MPSDPDRPALAQAASTRPDEHQIEEAVLKASKRRVPSVRKSKGKARRRDDAESIDSAPRLSALPRLPCVSAIS